MSTIIATGFLVYSIYLILKDYKRGMLFYIFSIYVAPVFNFGFIRIEFFLVSILPVVFVCLVKNNGKLHNIEINNWLNSYILVSIAATAISVFIYNVLNFQGISLLGMILRTLFVSIIASAKLQFKDVIKVFEWLIVLNFIAVVIQMLINQSTKLFFDLYYTESMIPLMEVRNLGYFNRAYGLFPTPIFLGTFSLMCLTFLLFYGKRNYITLIEELLCLIMGLASLTKTFILGTVILGILFIVKWMISAHKTLYVRTVISIGLMAICTTVIIFELYIHNYPIFWYLKFLTKPLDSLTSRYSSSVGVLSKTTEIILENPIIGVGYNNIIGEYTGDSFLYCVLHDAGAIGIMLFIAFFIKVSYKKHNKDIFFILVVFSVLNVSSIIFFEPIGLIILYAITIFNNYSCAQVKRGISSS